MSKEPGACEKHDWSGVIGNGCPDCKVEAGEKTKVLSQACIVFTQLEGTVDIRSFGTGKMEEYADASLALIRTAAETITRNR